MKTGKQYFILTVLFLFACREREEPENSISGYAFYVSGKFDSTHESTIIAGMDDFYMNTSYKKNADDVYEFTGKMEQQCIGCTRALSITLLNYKPTASAADYDPDSAFSPGKYLYYTPNAPGPNRYRVSFNAEPSATGVINHLWDFGDGTTSTLANPVKEFPATGNFMVTYTAVFAFGCSSTISYPLNLRASAAGANNAGFGYSHLNGDSIRLFTESSGSILWDLGQGNFSTSVSPVIVMSEGVRKISLTRVTLAGDTIITIKNVPAHNYLLCNANFTHYAYPMSNISGLSEVIIERTGADGKVYSSKNVAQSPLQYFEILSSSDYIPNTKGEKTRRLKIAFDCLVSDGSQMIRLKNMRATIALAYP